MTSPSLTDRALPPLGSVSIPDRLRAAFKVMDAGDRPEAWITVSDRDDLLARAEHLERQQQTDPSSVPLAGLLVAVKDNIDVAGLPTTAACPSFAYSPAASSPSVARLLAAGALILGKTNLDQFATGLVGTRSPYGAVRHATRPDYISGGSSSGSAVVVALGIVDVALGTDTAGSGRVPAALHGLIGIKPTLGLVSTTGVVPACRSYDTVTVLARDLTTARNALAVIVGVDDTDPASRSWAHDTRLAPPGRPRIGIPAERDLIPLSAEARRAFAATVSRIRDLGMITVDVDLDPFLRAARLLYDGALVAERYEAAGKVVEARSPDLDPTVAHIVAQAGTLPASRLVEDRALLGSLRAAAVTVFDPASGRSHIDALLLPTTTEHPTIDAVTANPLGINARMGTYTNFVNLFDLCAIAVPAGIADGSPFGVSFIAPAFADQVVIDLAGQFLDESQPDPLPTNTVELVVFGAHLRGQPLNGQLLDLGARFSREITTSERYRMVHLEGKPDRPGISPVSIGGVSLRGEAWTLTETALSQFICELPEPMGVGRITLADGTHVLGFQCTNSEGGRDISAYGSWVEYRAERAPAVASRECRSSG